MLGWLGQGFARIWRSIESGPGRAFRVGSTRAVFDWLSLLKWSSRDRGVDSTHAALPIKACKGNTDPTRTMGSSELSPESVGEMLHRPADGGRRSGLLPRDYSGNKQRTRLRYATRRPRRAKMPRNKRPVPVGREVSGGLMKNKALRQAPLVASIGPPRRRPTRSRRKPGPPAQTQARFTVAVATPIPTADLVMGHCLRSRPGSRSGFSLIDFVQTAQRSRCKRPEWSGA